MKKYLGIMKMRTLPIYGPLDLEKFRAHPLILGGGAWFAISSFRDTPEKRHGTCQNVEEKKFIFQGFEMQLKK